ncbi:MAG: hypothetical protein FWF09_05615 [Bacteroidales bacterium]|jgi:thioredoxin-related protein|nr:hypothetical protein [Bacteroidales bacterium]
MKKIIIALFIAGIATVGFSQEKVQPKWQDFSTTINAKMDKITMVYVYNVPCDLCTTTEAIILADSTVISALTKDFIATKFDAGTKEDVTINGQTYPYSAFTEEAGINIAAVVLLDGKMGYPSYVFYKEGEKVGVHFPVQETSELLQILKYYSSGDYKETPYEEWIKKQ